MQCFEMSLSDLKVELYFYHLTFASFPYRMKQKLSHVLNIFYQGSICNVFRYLYQLLKVELNYCHKTFASFPYGMKQK